jgi:dihydrofolate reductase
MRKLIVAEFISLDGVIQAPGGPDEDPSGEFRFGGWQVPYHDEAIGRAVLDLFSQPFELLLGRRTYDIWAAYWPRIGAASPSHPIAGPFNSVRKHVATHRPDTLDWQNSHALAGDLANAVRALQRQDGGYLLTHGSGDMVRQLLAAGLVDELRLLIYPVLLGRGKRLFGDNAQVSAFTLAHSTSTPSGVLITRYVRSGEVRTGTFEEAE